jgi:hypothetical protein
MQFLQSLVKLIWIFYFIYNFCYFGNVIIEYARDNHTFNNLDSNGNTKTGGENMSDRGTSNAPNTRNPERPHSKPSRLDQFGDMMFGNDDKAFGAGVTSRKEKKSYK